jgi:hypothetical protein
MEQSIFSVLLSRFRQIFSRDRAGSVRESMMFVGRARLITHLFDEWGEQASSEFSFPSKPPGYDPLLVFEFAPWGARTYWTYCTAGLSISPGMDAHPTDGIDSLFRNSSPWSCRPSLPTLL